MPYVWRRDLHSHRSSGISESCEKRFRAAFAARGQQGKRGKASVEKKKRTRQLLVFALIVLALFVGALLCPGGGESESIQDVMRDAVLHEHLKVSLFGLIEVNPGLISAYVVTAILIVFALVCRIFVIPRFTLVPGKFQLLLEQPLFERLHLYSRRLHLRRNAL